MGKLMTAGNMTMKPHMNSDLTVLRAAALSQIGCESDVGPQKI